MEYKDLKFTILMFTLFTSINVFGYDIEVDGIYYKLNTKDYKSVRVVSGNAPYTGSLHIPDSITYKGKKLAVTGIYELRNSSLDTLTILSNNYGQFGFQEGALSGTTVKHFIIEDSKYGEVSFSSFPQGLESMYVGKEMWFTSIYKSKIVGKQEKLKELKIGRNAGSIAWEPFFTECESIEKVISEIDNPIDIHINMFSTKTYLNAILYVPKGTIDFYKNCVGWNAFFNITDEEVPNNIGILRIGNTLQAIYDLKGQKKSIISKGINIVRLSDGTVKKMFK